MPETRIVSIVTALLLAGLVSSTLAQDATPVSSDEVTVVAAGLTNPRGFTWGPEGDLYLALAGTGGETEGDIGGAPSGLFGGPTASVVRIEDGCAVPFAERLPSSFWPGPEWIWGVHDVAFQSDDLYVLSSGGGSDYGTPDMPNGVYRIDDDGSTELVADLSSFFREVPTTFIPPDYGADGSLFDMEVDGDRLWISEAVGGRILTVTLDGEITLIADLSEMMLTPTGIALAPEGGVFLGFETTVPFDDGTSKVVHVAEDGTVTDVWTGLTAVTDVALGPDGELYAVEMATGNLDEAPYLRPASGRIVRQTGPDTLEEVVTDLRYGVYLGFDADGELYVSTPAFGPDLGVGQGGLLRIDISGGEPVSAAGVDTAVSTCAGDATPAASPVA